MKKIVYLFIFTLFISIQAIFANGLGNNWYYVGEENGAQYYIDNSSVMKNELSAEIDVYIEYPDHTSYIHNMLVTRYDKYFAIKSTLSFDANNNYLGEINHGQTEMLKSNEEINAIVRKKIGANVVGLVKAGMSPQDAIAIAEQDKNYLLSEEYSKNRYTSYPTYQIIDTSIMDKLLHLIW